MTERKKGWEVGTPRISGWVADRVEASGLSPDAFFEKQWKAQEKIQGVSIQMLSIEHDADKGQYWSRAVVIA